MDDAEQVEIYKGMLTAIIQRFIKLMGEPALSRARRVRGLQAGDDGSVTRYEGEGWVMLMGLTIEYQNLLGREAVTIINRTINLSSDEGKHKVKIPSILN